MPLGLMSFEMDSYWIRIELVLQIVQRRVGLGTVVGIHFARKARL
jgi:hypothetical protein